MLVCLLILLVRGWLIGRLGRAGRRCGLRVSLGRRSRGRLCLRCGGRRRCKPVQFLLYHVLDDGNFLLKQVHHQAKINTADAPLIHNARSALGIDLDFFKVHEAAGVFDRHKAAEECVDGIFVAAVFFECFKGGMNYFKLLAHCGAEGVDVVIFSTDGNDGRHDHLNRGVLLLAGGGCRFICVLCFSFLLPGCGAVLAGLRVEQLLRQRNGAAGLGQLKLFDHWLDIEGGGGARFNVDALHLSLKHVDNKQQQVDELVGRRNFALTNIVEQGFRLVGKGIQLCVADNAAVALHVVEKAENIVDQFVPANGVFFQIEQAVGQAFDGVVGLVDKIFEMPLAKRGEGIRRYVGQGEHPFLARHGRSVGILPAVARGGRLAVWLVSG